MSKPTKAFLACMALYAAMYVEVTIIQHVVWWLFY